MTSTDDSKAVAFTNALKPVFSDENAVVVALSASASYAPLLAVTLQSIIENSSNTRLYDIVVLDSGIAQSDRNLLLQQVADYTNVSLRFVDVSEQISDSKLPARDHITSTSYARFTILECMQSYSKVLYLDVDLVVLADIADLFDTDITGYLLGAVRDSVTNAWYYMPGHPTKELLDKVVKIAEPCGYFNAGVLLMNIAELNKLTSCSHLMQLAQDPKWVWMDQDVLNHICAGRVKYLDQAWNYEAHKETYYVPDQIPEVHLPDWLKEQYLAARQDPKIVHYVGHSTPCFHPESEHSWYYWPYAKHTAFFERLLQNIANEHHKSRAEVVWEKATTGRFSALSYRVLNTVAPVNSPLRARLSRLKHRR